MGRSNDDVRTATVAAGTVEQHGSPRGKDPTAQGDRWQELELFVEQVARLVLHAHSLAERMGCLRAATGWEQADRAGRVHRLRDMVDVGQRAIVSAVRTGQAPATRSRR